MAYNRINKLRQYKRIIDLTKAHYEEGITTYKGVWRKHIYPVYPISYALYMKIMSLPNIERSLAEEESRIGVPPEQQPGGQPKNQLRLFDDNE